MMQDWGKGMLMTGREYDEVHEFDEQLGLRELRAKVNGKAGLTDKNPPNRLSINAEFNYGAHSVEVVRKYLDSGALVQLLENDLWKDDRCWNGADGHKYITLIACAMSLGCTLPKRIAEDLWKQVHPAFLARTAKLYPAFQRRPLAIAQLKKAIKNYIDGVPYDFGNKTFLETSMAELFPMKGDSKYTDLGSVKLIEIVLPNGSVVPQIVGPPNDVEMGLEKKPIHPAHVCANCGKEKGDGDNDLMACARCHDRKYCSKECQKKHWKLHKIICTIPDQQMKMFLDSLPSGLKDEAKIADEMREKAVGNNPMIISAGMDQNETIKKKGGEGESLRDGIH